MIIKKYVTETPSNLGLILEHVTILVSSKNNEGTANGQHI